MEVVQYRGRTSCGGTLIFPGGHSKVFPITAPLYAVEKPPRIRRSMSSWYRSRVGDEAPQPIGKALWNHHSQGLMSGDVTMHLASPGESSRSFFCSRGNRQHSGVECIAYVLRPQCYDSMNV